MPPRSPMGGVKTHVEDNHTHDVRYVLRNLWKYLYRYRFGMFAVLALSLLSNVLALLGPGFPARPSTRSPAASTSISQAYTAMRF